MVDDNIIENKTELLQKNITKNNMNSPDVQKIRYKYTRRTGSK